MTLTLFVHIAVLIGVAGCAFVLGFVLSPMLRDLWRRLGEADTKSR